MGSHIIPVKFVGSICIFVGIQLEFHNLVYAVDPGVQSPNKVYMIFALVGLCCQKSEVKNPHRCRLAEVCVKILDAPRSIPMIAKTKTTKA